MTLAPLKIYIFTLDGIGHMNACLGIAQALAARGHSVTFLFNEKMAGSFSRYGFEEILLKERAKPNAKPASAKVQETPENPLKTWGKLILSSGMLGPASPIEKMKLQLESGMNPFKNLLEELPGFNLQIEEAIKRGAPDCFLVDMFLVLPAILMASIPWISLCSAQPLAILPKKGKLVPCGTGKSQQKL